MKLSKSKFNLLKLICLTYLKDKKECIHIDSSGEGYVLVKLELLIYALGARKALKKYQWKVSRVEPSRVEPTFSINNYVFLEFKWECNKKETNSWSRVSLLSNKCNLINMWFLQEEEFMM